MSKYENYLRELASRPSQVTSVAITTEAVQAIALKYCMEHEYLDSLLTLGFIPGAETHNDLQYANLREYLETQERASKQAITIQKLNRRGKADFKTNRHDKESVGRTHNLLASYHALLDMHSVRWVM